MKYFSIDYRSPPSGMGQILDTEQPRMIGDKYNMILVDYGCDDHEDPHYVQTKYFHSEHAAQEGWAGPIINEIIQYLRDQGVSHVYDSELGYQMGMSQHLGFHYYPIDIWANIIAK